MPSPYSLFIAYWYLAPAAQVWCALLLDNPSEQMARSWSRACLQAARNLGTNKHIGDDAKNVEQRRDQDLSGVASDECPLGSGYSKSTQQVHDGGFVLAAVTPGEHAAIVELAGHRPEAGVSVSNDVGYDQCKVLRMPIGVARDSRPKRRSAPTAPA